MSNYFVHKNAIVETTHIGEKSRIWAFAHILPGAVIGKNANICDGCFIENKVIIGDNVTLKCGVYLWDGISIEDNVQVGPAAAFTNDLYPRAKNTSYIMSHTLLKKGCSIGANATLLPITVGQYALVGAGAVITKDVPDFGIVYGNPAQLHGYICICATKLSFKNDEAKCQCGRRYTKEDTQVSLIND